MGMGGDLSDIAGDGHFGGDFHGDAHIGGDFHGDATMGDSMHGGIAGDHDTPLSTASDAQHPDSSWLFGVISLRSLVAAAAFFGLAGLGTLNSGYAESTSLIVAILVGLCAMYGMYWLMRLISRLDSSGNERIDNAIGRQARVYIPIPAAGNGAGKVQLSMQNRIVEYQAVTSDSQPLKTGESVEVIGVAGSDIVEVRRASNPRDFAPEVSHPITGDA
jgi:membrane protein implicated in regulation of membrane protease activity